MKLIGAGFSRTGTMSLKAALGKLGYRSYHMEEAVINFEKGHLEMWNAYMEGRSDMDWHKLLEGYDATADLPAALYYRELLAAFPEARVILTVRDPEKWWQSTAKLVHMQNTLVERLGSCLVLENSSGCSETSSGLCVVARSHVSPLSHVSSNTTQR